MVIDSRSSEAAAAAAAASRGPQRTFTENLHSTFSSPLAWILVLALIVTWSCVFVIMLDLADYKTVSGELRSGCVVGRSLRCLKGRLKHFIVKKHYIVYLEPNANKELSFSCSHCDNKV